MSSMKIRSACVSLGFSSLVLSFVLSLVLSAVLPLAAQTSSSAGSTAQLPRLVKFSATLKDANGNALTGVVGITFALYSEPSGGAPLWLETQNVQPDKNGHYTVLLGSTKPEGLPLDLFVSGQARWLGAQAQLQTESQNESQAEPARVLLAAVPYAMKAADAETVGGLPPSAFVMALPVSSGAAVANGATSSSASPASLTPSNVTTTGGTVNALPLWTTATNIQSSTITQTGSGSTAKIGIGTKTPAVTLDVKGAENVGGTLTLPATGTAISTKGYNSQPDLMIASVFNSGSATAVAQKFQLQAEPVNNDKTTASGTLNLLYGSGTATPAETGLKISNKGQITFATGQTFPGTGPGTVTSVGLAASASDFTVSGSPVTSTGTLNLAWTVAPTSANTANAIVKRDGSGNFAADVVTANTLNAADVNLSDALLISSSAGVAATVVDSAPFATTIYGEASALTGEGWGVEGGTGSTASNAYGVVGYASAFSGSPIGVYGAAYYSPAGVGVFGQNGTESATGVGFGGAGVWGDGGTSGYFGVLGTVDDGSAGYFVNNSPSGFATLYAYASNSASYPFFATGPTGYCYVDGANLNCTGAKNAVVPIDGGKRTVAMSAIESPQNWFEDAGSTQLVNGAAVVAMDPVFLQTVAPQVEYQVFLTPYGDCKGLYVTNRTAASFEVHELGGGTASVSFTYRIMALRKNYENVRFADHTHDLDGNKRMLERIHAAGAMNRQSHMPTKKLAPMHAVARKTTGR
jgi:hypothetical protein